MTSATTAAQAQTPTDVTLDTVIITGSHIPRADMETALPVQIITRKEIERSGVTTVSQLLEQVSANVNGHNDALTVGDAFRPGLASANLRGLGTGMTLVLLNGRRLANYAFDGATVDLNSIPLSAIDRVEILKDGASAIYGTDAIAGVINFILRKDYAGIEATGYYAATQHGGGNTSQAILTLGHGNPATDRYNVFASVAYQNDQPLAARDRQFAKTGFLPSEGINALSQSTFPANIRTGRSVLNPTAASGCAPPTSLPLPPAACGYDFTTAIDLLPAIERASLLTRGSLQLNSVNELYAEYMYARNRFDTQVAPTPVGGGNLVAGPLLYPAGGPFYPSEFAAANGLSGDLMLAWRAIPLGPRIDSVTTDMHRAVVGIEGLLGGWNYNAAAVYSTNSQEDEFKSGFLYVNRLIPAMATGLINPFGPSGPAGDALLLSTQYSGTPHSSRGTTSLINAFASREVAQLPGGPVALALGIDARRERSENTWDPELQSGDPFLGFAPQTITGSRSVYALFTELNVPIVRTVDAQLAVRFDQYSDFGSTTNPKVAVRWQPMKSLLLRGSWGTGFRAPPLYDLNEPRFVGGIAEGVVDPVRCPVTELLDDCDGLVNLYVGGNPDLQPETSKQWNVGVVWEPISGLSLGIDYWNIHQKQRIDIFFWEFVIQSLDTIGSGRVIRGPVDPNFPTLPGPIVAIDTTLANIAAVETSGIDVSLRYAGPKTDIGVFGATLQGTYVRQWDAQYGDFGSTSFLGTNANGLAIPRWRSYLSLNWTYGVWGATLAQTYTGGYTDEFPDASGNMRKVSAFSVWDLQGTYTGIGGLQLALGVRNLFDTDPPFSNQRGSFQIGYDPQLANPLGRQFYLRATYAFR